MTIWKAIWKADYDDVCENCGETRPVMDCAELGDLCKECFRELDREGLD
jgi:ribosomal protein S14